MIFITFPRRSEMFFLLSLGESETESRRELRQHSHHAEVTDPGGAKNK